MFGHKNQYVEICRRLNAARESGSSNGVAQIYMTNAAR